MNEDTEEKIGPIMVDGKIYNLDQMQIDEIKTLMDNLAQKKKEIMSQINAIIKADKTGDSED